MAFIQEFIVGPDLVGGLSISHLLFTEDTNLFCDANRDQHLYVGMVLTCFEAVTGLKVSLGKSEVVPIGYLGNMADLAEVLCCKIGRLPMTCLGIPIGLPLRHFLCGILTIEKFYNREDGTEINWLKDYCVKGREANFVEEYAFVFTNILSLHMYSSHVLGK